MNTEENTQGNPDAFDKAVGSDSDDFFSALDNSVNGLVTEQEESSAKSEETPETQGPAQPQANSQVSQSSEHSELDNLKKRYSDSSREAQNLRAQLNQLKPFVPVLEAMKKDDGLVNHVRDYLEDGGKVNEDVKKQLKLDENFEFDPDEMVSNPESDSRKVFDTMVSKIVNKKAQQLVDENNRVAQSMQHKETVKSHAVDFMKRHGMSQEEFKSFATKASERFQKNGLTFDDMYSIMNKGEVSQNVANATKNDMLNQMKNVRNIPASVSSANNAGKANTVNDDVFDALLSSDGNIEELLG